VAPRPSRRGGLQQVASPRTLYDEPANLFVAGYIGSPPMNLVAATVEGGRLHLPFVACALPPDLRATIGRRQLLVVGLRPEAFEDGTRADAAPASPGATFTARVDVAEWLGNQGRARADAMAELLEEADAAPCGPFGVPAWRWSKEAAPSSWYVVSRARRQWAISRISWPTATIAFRYPRCRIQ
jgi:ABC-type sugar transport system ATPase subunit